MYTVEKLKLLKPQSWRGWWVQAGYGVEVSQARKQQCSALSYVRTEQEAQEWEQEWRNLFLNSKKYCKRLLKNICSSLWGSSFTSGKFRVPLHTSKWFLPPSRACTGLLQGHWAFVPPLSTNGHRACSALTGTQGNYPSLTHGGRLPSQGAVSLLSRAQQKTSRAISQLLCSFPDEFQCQASKP